MNECNIDEDEGWREVMYVDEGIDHSTEGRQEWKDGWMLQSLPPRCSVL